MELLAAQRVALEAYHKEALSSRYPPAQWPDHGPQTQVQSDLHSR